MLFQAQINSFEDQLPEEPGPDCLDPVSILRFRMPNNESITRRFLASSPLKVRSQKRLLNALQKYVL